MCQEGMCQEGVKGVCQVVSRGSHRCSLILGVIRSKHICSLLDFLILNAALFRNFIWESSVCSGCLRCALMYASSRSCSSFSILIWVRAKSVMASKDASCLCILSVLCEGMAGGGVVRRCSKRVCRVGHERVWHERMCHERM